MSAKKQTSGKTTKKSTTGRKTTSAKSGSKTHSNPQPNQPLLSPRVRAILFGLAATLFFGLIFIKGATGWMAIRSFFFGLLGICIFLVPIVFIYLCPNSDHIFFLCKHFIKAEQTKQPFEKYFLND